MKLDELVRIINCETKSVMGGVLLHTKMQTPNEMEAGIRWILGSIGYTGLKQRYPGLTSSSIRSAMSGSFSEVVVKRNDDFYAWKKGSEKTENACLMALHFASENGMSMYSILTKESAAPLVASLFEFLHGGNNLRITDLANLTQKTPSSITNHITRLDELGMVRFEQVRKIKFRWNYKKNFAYLGEDVRRAVSHYKSHTAYLIRMAVAMGNYLYRNKENMDSTELTEATGYDEKRQDMVQRILRIMENRRYVIADTDFNARRRSAVIITPLGEMFYEFLQQLADYENVELSDEIMIPGKRIVHALDLYEASRCRRQTRDDRVEQINYIIEKNPGITRQEIDAILGATSNNYLAGMRKRGFVDAQVGHVGSGKKPPLVYTPNSKKAD